MVSKSKQIKEQTLNSLIDGQKFLRKNLALKLTELLTLFETQALCDLAILFCFCF